MNKLTNSPLFRPVSTASRESTWWMDRTPITHSTLALHVIIHTQGATCQSQPAFIQPSCTVDITTGAPRGQDYSGEKS